jgi:carbonic anhydrase/acetyltransferase-like protein (isoleucine patch superfamily)
VKSNWHQHRNPNGSTGGWVENTACVVETVYIGPDAVVYDNAHVLGNAQVFGNAQVYENAWIYGYAWVYGYTRVFGDATVCDNAEVYERAQVSGNARVCKVARVYGNAQVSSGWIDYGIHDTTQQSEEITNTEQKQAKDCDKSFEDYFTQLQRDLNELSELRAMKAELIPLVEKLHSILEKLA